MYMATHVPIDKTHAAVIPDKRDPKTGNAASLLDLFGLFLR